MSGAESELATASSLTTHCDCGTDVRFATSDDLSACPNCETAFGLSLVELPEGDTRHSPRHSLVPRFVTAPA